MMSFLEWVQVHNNWFPALSFYVLCSIWAFILSHKGTWKHVVVSFVMFVILGATTINYFLLYEDGYKEYTKKTGNHAQHKKHWMKCMFSTM